MSEWKEYKLGEVIKTNCKSIGGNYPYSNILYLDTGSVITNKVIELQEIELVKAPSRAKRLVHDEDIIYSTVRPNQLHYGFIKNPLTGEWHVTAPFRLFATRRNNCLPKVIFFPVRSFHRQFSVQDGSG
jgi:type I restriction enzyme S subunit